MNKSVILLVLITFTIFVLFALGLIRITGLFVGFRTPAEGYEWWNVSWRYRVELRINTTSYDRTDWPIEYDLNFTDLMPSGSFDENSTRVIEYNSSGHAIYELPSQFDKKEDYDAVGNAAGTLVFLLNGTTAANTERTFFVYYDNTDNGTKEKANYPTDLETDLSDGWSGDEFNVNSTMLNYWVDTIRGQNTSGIIRVIDVNSAQDILDWPLATNERTYEYIQLSNGTSNFTFNLTDNATLKYSGPIRIVVEQKGDEIIWNSETKTELFVVKRYIFYDKIRWIKLEINFTNIESYNTTRNSSFAGALGLDAERAFGIDWQSGFGNTSEPGWWYAADYYNDYQAGIIHVNQTGTTNFWVPDSSSKDKIGIQLNSTNISTGSSILETAVFRFSYQEDYTDVRDLRNRLGAPVETTLELPEILYVAILSSTNETVFNRNETIRIVGDISAGDPYNLTEYMNATLDMGTPSTVDDQTIILYDDGAHDDNDTDDEIFANVFSIVNDATTGVWTINFTTYSENLEVLNSTNYTFNVTDILNVTVNITNDKPQAGTIVFGNMYVKNYLQKISIIGATVNCSYGSTEIEDITDHSNGTYSFNFTSPAVEDVYILTCNATKNGNFGEGNDTFTTEPGVTNVSITSQPSNPFVYNVMLYENGSFVIAANATVVKNGTAYDVNISLELLSGWDSNSTTNSESCGEISPFTSCVKGFNITLPNNTAPGNYYINVTVDWRNPDYSTSSNYTGVNVTVEPNSVVDVEQDNVTGEVADGTSIIVGNFTVLSIGNYQLENITFNCTSGIACNDFTVEFIPANITTPLSGGSNQSVSINVTVPLGYTPGTYSSVINVSAENDEYDTFTLYSIVPTRTNVSITTSIPSYMAYNVTQTSNETFAFYVNLTDVQNGSARYTNITLDHDPWYSNSSSELCGNLTKGEVCTIGFNITILSGTPIGNYYLNITANWTHPDNSFGTNTTSFLVTVIGNPKVDVAETSVTGNASDGAEGTVGNFTVLSVGNNNVDNIGFNCYAGSDICDNFTLNLNPSSISTLAPGENETVIVNVTPPIGFPAGTYNGTLNVSAENDGYENLTLFVTVLNNRTWDLTPSTRRCEKSTQQPEGVACEVNVTNLGNIIINFTVSPIEENHTTTNETSFNITEGDWHVFSIEYNVTGEPPDTFNSSYIIDAIQTDANPDNITINVSLVPYIPPLINISVQPNETYQNDTIRIWANVTDQSGSNIAWARVNVTRPGGYTDSLDMYKINESGNFTMWEITYPNSTNETNGSTYEVGLYNVVVYAGDNIGNTNEENSSIIIYSKLDVVVSTLTNIYYQGDTASIYYVSRDIDLSPVENVTVSFIVYDSQANITYISGNYTTDEYGTISPHPTFEIPSDSPLGYYTLSSHSTYYDSLANKTLEFKKNHTFEIYSRTVTVTGLFADLETAVVWYPPLPGYPTPIIRFGILTYNGEGAPVDPDYMNLSVYKPDGHLCLSDTMANMNKETTGYYTYQSSFICIDSITPTGMYLAVLNATQGSFETLKLKAFRVASGGPYDVRLQLLETEVEQGDALDYVVIIENKGEVRQDVFVEYWSSPFGGNDSYGYWSEYVLTRPLTNESFTRSMEIKSDQPLGNYLLFARVSFDATQPPLIVNSSFTVLAKVTPTTTVPPTYPIPPYIPTAAAPTPAPIPTAELRADLMISRYNNNISLARDVTILESVIVNNTGLIDLNNVSLYLVGVPATWYNITPENYKLLPVGDSAAFVITLRAPTNAETITYSASLVAASGVVSDQKNIYITVFPSLEELLRDELRKLKIELEDLQLNTKLAEIEGKDVSNVELLIDEIKTQVELAEGNLEKRNLDDASSNIANAKNLLEKAKNLLESLERVKVKEFLPFWVIVFIIISISVIVFAIMYFKRKKVKELLRPWIIPFGKVVEGVKGKKITKEDVEKEKDRIERMLKVLEKEKDEGIISVGAYKEMRKSLESKLEKLKKKLK